MNQIPRTLKRFHHSRSDPTRSRYTPATSGYRFPVTLVLIALVLTTACGKDDVTREIERTRTVEKSRSLPRGGFPSGVRFRYERAGASDRPGPASGYSWKLPAGWKEIESSQFRQGNFVIPALPDMQCYLSVLPGRAGGVGDNVNRWRSQMGQPPYTPEQIAALPKMQVLSMQATLVDFEGSFSGMGGDAREGYRLLGVLLVDGTNTLFVKMTGPKGDVTREQGNFLEFVESIARGDGIDHSGHGHGAEPHPESSDGDPRTSLRWTAPEGWTEGPGSGMRLVTFKTEGGAQCLISALSGDGGGLRPNLDMWRQQMGRKPLTDLEFAALPRITVLGRPSVFLTIEGSYTGKSEGKPAGKPAGEPAAGGSLMYGVVATLPGSSLFIKMTGPSNVMEQEKERFVKFCELLE